MSQIYIYIYAFGWRFYPKQFKGRSGYAENIILFLSRFSPESNPQLLPALSATDATTEP